LPFFFNEAPESKAWIENRSMLLSTFGQERSDAMRVRRILALGGMVIAASACVPPAEPLPPQPQPAPQPQPLPAPPAAQDWRDFPLTPGQWLYRTEGGTSQASFGAANSEPQFIIRCDPARRQIVLSREGVPTAPSLTVRTSYTARALPVTIQREPLAYASATVPAGDPILDSIAFSRGRFTVEAPGLPTLVIPAWPEPARVMEDCRA
jgi:hypothetical protein